MYLECVALHLLLYLNCKVFTKNPHFSSFFNFLHKLLNPVRTSGHLFFMNVEKVACRWLFERYGGPSPLATILMLPLLSLGRAPSPSTRVIYRYNLALIHFSTYNVRQTDFLDLTFYSIKTYNVRQKNVSSGHINHS